jgi:Fe2+ or Zn2+ uptake regulation protein
MATSARGALQDTGYRLTGPRRSVVEALERVQPCSIEDLCAALPGVGRATVFRTVKLLQELDVVCRVPMEDGTVRYQIGEGGHHHHLVCRVCGSVTEFEDAGLDSRIAGQAKSARFQLEGHSVELYGVCARCAADGPVA